MCPQLPPQAEEILNRRFHRDALIALATATDGMPHVRTVDAFYEEGAFYLITHAQSAKMAQIARNPAVAVCGEWFTAHGRADSLGWIGAPGNAALAAKLCAAFAAWLGNGHVDLADRDTCILRVRLTDGVLMADGRRWALTFSSEGREAAHT